MLCALGRFLANVQTVLHINVRDLNVVNPDLYFFNENINNRIIKFALVEKF